MRFNKRTTTIILWAVSIGLLAGMVISFTPGLSMIGASNSARGPVEMTVNGQNIHQWDVQQARSNALFSLVTEGEVGQDLRRLLVDQLARQAVLQQAASRINVSNGEIRAAVNDFRQERGVAGSRNDRAYQNLIAGIGFTDQSFRDYLREQIRIGKFEDRLVGNVEVSDEEVQTFYQAHLTSYQTEERIVARQIVVDNEALAQQLRRRAMDGADYSALAREFSLDLADRDGAIGASAGETEPRPVGRPALPTNVAVAAFGLRGVGITDVVLSNQRYFVVKVEEYLPAAVRPFEEVEETVRQDALNAKKSGIVEAELDRLRDEAVLTFPASSELSFSNPVVAEVNGVDIRAVDLDAALYTNPQIQQSLSPEFADLIVGLFKPTVLSQVIDTEVAYQAAGTLGVPFVGTRAGIAQAALGYIGRDATATEAELREYYESNQAAYTVQAEASVTRFDFGTQDQAINFRQAIIDGTDITLAAASQNGVMMELGYVKPGDLEFELNSALFNTQAFEALPGGALDVSDVLVLRPVNTQSSENDEEVVSDELFVVLVADRIPQRVRAFEDVRAQVDAQVLAQKRQQERMEWLEEQRVAANVVEHSLGVPDALLPMPEFDLLGEPEGDAADSADEPAADSTDLGAADEAAVDEGADDASGDGDLESE